MKSLRKTLFFVAVIDAIIAVLTVSLLAKGFVSSAARMNVARLDELIANVHRFPAEKAIEVLSFHVRMATIENNAMASMINRAMLFVLLLSLLHITALWLLWSRSRRISDGDHQ